MAPLRMSEACRKQITEQFEGRQLKAYRDSVGVWTIGYGHTSAAGAPVVTPGLSISGADADTILSRDLAKFEAGVATLLTGSRGEILQREFDALVDLAFNIGLGNLRTSSLLAAYRRGDKATAARKFADWNKAGGKALAGLTRRRAAETAWFFDGRLARTSAVGLLDVHEPPARDVDHPDNAVTRWLAGRRAPQLEAA